MRRGRQTGGWSPESSAAGGHNPYLIEFKSSRSRLSWRCSTPTIANVALEIHARMASPSAIDVSRAPTFHHQRSRSANAIVLSIRAGISTVIGRKRFYMYLRGDLSIRPCDVRLCRTSAVVWSCFASARDCGGAAWRPSEQGDPAESFPAGERKRGPVPFASTAHRGRWSRPW